MRIILNNYLVTLSTDDQIIISQAQMREDSLMIRFDTYNSQGEYITSIWYGTEEIKKVELTSLPLPSQCSTNLLPADGDTDVDIIPTFNWTAVVGATRYELFISTDGINFTTRGTSQIPFWSFNIYTALEPATTYHWYVVPQNDGGQMTGCIINVTSFTTISLSTTTTTTYVPTTTTTTNSEVDQL